MTHNFYDLKIKDIISETQNAKSIVFEIPSDLKDAFQYKAGQYLTLKFDLNGEEERRSYSLSSAPSETNLRVCVKRVQGGKISNYICDHLKTGDTISVMSPDGRFAFEPDAERQGQYYLFAAGSGITPIISIAKEILETEPLSTVHLLYGNTDDEQIIYKTEIEKLVAKYDGQFLVKYTYSSKAEKKGLFGSLFKKTSIELPFYPGRISKDTIKKFLGDFNVVNSQRAFSYICGPGTMNEDVKKELIKQSFLKHQVHFESFGTTDSEVEIVTSTEDFTGISEVTVELDKQIIPLTIDASVTVLDALLKAGYDPPHSCCSGACSSCMAKLKSGTVKMDVSHALDEDDIQEGYILTCQSRVTSDKVHIVYE